MNKFLRIILFWSACWGLTEAIAGYVLHLSEVSPGILLYFFGAYCLMKAFIQSGYRISVPIAVTLLTALLKLSNLFFTPFLFHYRVYYPVLAILGEGLITSFLLLISITSPVNKLLNKLMIKNKKM